MFIIKPWEGWARECLLKGKAQYNRPPSTNYFISDDFDIANIIYFLLNKLHLTRRSTVLSLPLQLVFPGWVTLWASVSRNGSQPKRFCRFFIFEPSKIWHSSSEDQATSRSAPQTSRWLRRRRSWRRCRGADSTARCDRRRSAASRTTVLLRPCAACWQCCSGVDVIGLSFLRHWRRLVP